MCVLVVRMCYGRYAPYVCVYVLVVRMWMYVCMYIYIHIPQYRTGGFAMCKTFERTAAPTNVSVGDTHTHTHTPSFTYIYIHTYT